MKMYLLTLYDWDYNCSPYEVLLYRSKVNAEKRAKEYMTEFVYKTLRGYDEPEDHGYETWEEFIEDAVKSGYQDEVFLLESIKPED